MKILVVHNHYRQRGGEDAVFETECALLERGGHTVVRYEKGNDFDESRGRIGLALRTLWNRTAYREIRDLIRRERPDVMHCHNTFPSISPSIYWAAAEEGIPVVQTLHNYRLCCLNGYLFRDGAICERCLGRAPLRGVFRRCYRDSLGTSGVVAAMLLLHRILGTWRRKVTRYIALTEFGRDKFIAAGLPAAKIVVKPNALAGEGASLGVRKSDSPIVKKSESQKVQESKGPEVRESGEGKGRDADGAVTFLYLGRLSPEKGADVLVDAWRILCEGPDSPVPAKARLVIAGDGPERTPLEERSKGLSGIRFLGAVPKTNVPALLRNVSVLVFPSLCYEQFAITPMEAMEAGIPTIVSDVAHMSTLVRDSETGVVFHRDNPQSLAEVMATLAADPGRLADMGEEARRTYERSECRPDANLAALLRIYEEARSASCKNPQG